MALQSKNLLNEPPDIEELLNDLGHRLDRLKQLYEMYFLGIEKIEPGVARKEVQRAMLALQQQNIRNTGLRFKFNALLAKWNSYTTYWGRTIRAIENGTYVRHLQRAQRHAERDGKELPAEIVRIRERLLAATAQEKEQLRDEANAALKTPGAKAPAAATAPATESKPRAPSGQYSEFNAFKNFLDDETDGFPRVEEDDLKPQRAPEPARVKSTTPPPAPPRPTATTPPPLPPRAPIPTPTGARPAPPPPPTGATGPRPGPPAPPPAPPRPPGSPPAAASPLPPRPTTVPVTPPKSTPSAMTQVVKTIPGMSENELRNLHQQYIAARQTSGENTKVSYEGLVGSLAKQVPRILEQPGVKGVRFEVTTKDGKAIVKAIPEK